MLGARPVTGAKVPARSRGTAKSDPADLSRHCLGRRSVARVARPAALLSVALIAELISHLDLQAGLEHLADQPRNRPSHR